MDQFVAEWNTWRDSRTSVLAKPFGWLSVTGLHWFADGPTWPGAPGTFTVSETGWVDVILEPGIKAGPAAATFDLLNPGAEAGTGAVQPLSATTGEGTSGSGSGRVRADPVVQSPQVRVHENGFSAKLPKGGSLEWFTVGPVLYELIERAGKLGVRIRDSKSPLLAKFIEVPMFEADRSFVYVARFEPYSEPVMRAIATAQEGLTAESEAVGTVVFDTDTGELALVVTGNPAVGLNLNFHDATNGSSTAQWRTVDIGVPNADGTLIIDFNRAVNFPCAFTAFATCPAPVTENVIPFAVRAGEKRPPFFLAPEGLNTPFLFYRWWADLDPDQNVDTYARFGLDTTVVDPRSGDDDPTLLGFDGVAMSGGALVDLGRRGRSRLLKVATEALTSRIPVIGIGDYAAIVIQAQEELNDTPAQSPSGPEFRPTPGTVLTVFSNELDPQSVGFDVVHRDANGLIYVETSASIPFESELRDDLEFESAMQERQPVASWPEYVHRVASMVRAHR